LVRPLPSLVVSAIAPLPPVQKAASLAAPSDPKAWGLPDGPPTEAATKACRPGCVVADQ